MPFYKLGILTNYQLKDKLVHYFIQTAYHFKEERFYFQTVYVTSTQTLSIF